MAITKQIPKGLFKDKLDGIVKSVYSEAKEKVTTTSIASAGANYISKNAPLIKNVASNTQWDFNNTNLKELGNNLLDSVGDFLQKKLNGMDKMYEIYIDKILLPIAPSKIEIKYKGMNKTYDLTNGSQFNIIKPDGLRTITFDALIPVTRYPFSLYKNSVFIPAKKFIEDFKQLRNRKEPIFLKIIRGIPYNDEIKVSFEDFTIKEEAENGRDVLVSFTFKEFKDIEKVEITKIDIKRNINSLNSYESSAESNKGVGNNTTNNNGKTKATSTKVRPKKKGKLSNIIKSETKIYQQSRDIRNNPTKYSNYVPMKLDHSPITSDKGQQFKKVDNLEKLNKVYQADYVKDAEKLENHLNGIEYNLQYNSKPNSNGSKPKKPVGGGKALKHTEYKKTISDTIF